MGQKIANVVANNYHGNNEKNNVEVLKQGIVEVNVEKNGLDANFASAPVNNQFSISTPDSGTTITNQNTGVNGTAFNTDYPSNYSFTIAVNKQKVLIYNSSKELINTYVLNMPSDTTYIKYKREIYLVDISTGKRTLIKANCTGQFSTTVCILVRCYISGRSYDISFSTTNTNSYWKDSTGARVTSTVASYGDSISTTSNTVKIGAATYTLVAAAPQGETVKSTSVRLDSSSSTTPTTVNGPITVVGVITTQVNSYTVSWSKTNCSVSAYIGSTAEIINGGTVPYGTTVNFHITPNSGYKYNNSTEKTIETYTATSNITKTFIASAASTTLTINKDVNLSKIYYYQGGVWRESSLDQTIVSCTYGDTILVAGEPNTGYDAQYTKTSPKSVSINSVSGVTVTMESIIKSYTVKWSSSDCTVRYRYHQSTGQLIVNGASVAYGTVIYVEAIPNEGYTMNSYENSFVVTGNMNKSYSATINSYKITLVAQKNVSTMYYRINNGSNQTYTGPFNATYGSKVYAWSDANTGYEADNTSSNPKTINSVTASETIYLYATARNYTVSWSSSNCSTTMTYGSSGFSLSNGGSVPYGTTVYVSCVANTGYTMPSYERSFTVTGNMTKSYSANINYYTVTLNKGSNISTIYYNLNNTESKTYSSPFSAAYKSSLSMWASANSGYSPDYSSSNPVSTTITGSYDRTFYATANQYTVKWSTSNCSASLTYGSSRNPISNGQKLPYGTVVYVSCTPNNGYSMNSYSQSFTVTSNVNNSYSAKINSYTYTITGYDSTHMSAVHYKIGSGSEQTAYGNTSFSVNYGTSVYVYVDFKTGHTGSYNSYNSRWTSTCTGSETCSLRGQFNWYTLSFGGSGGTWTSGSGSSAGTGRASAPYGSTWSVSNNGNTGTVTLTMNLSTGGSWTAYWNPENWQRYESYQDGSNTRYHYVTRTKKGYISPTSGSVTDAQSFTGSSQTW